MYIRFSFLLLIAVSTCFFSAKKASPEMLTLEQLHEKVLNKEDEQLFVVNFWATWCKPCIEELPFFEEAGKKFKDKKVTVLLINLDFPSEKEKVARFVEKKNLQNQVYMLNAGNPNGWIDKIDPSWDGAIPATVMYKKGEKVFFREGDLTKTELDSIIQTKY